MGNEVPATATPVSEYEASVLLVVALTQALQDAPSEQVAVYSMALAWIETARGRAIIQNNPGNVTTSDSGPNDYWRPPWYPEQHDPKYDALHAKMLAGQAPRAFRAYPDKQTGWNSFAYEVVRRKPLLSAMAADDPLAVVRALRSTGYSSDYTDQTANSFRSLVAEFRSRNLFGGLRKVFEVEIPQPAQPVAQQQKKGSGGLLALLLGVVAAAGGAWVYLKTRGGK